jgi:hypothetical protein
LLLHAPEVLENVLPTRSRKCHGQNDLCKVGIPIYLVRVWKTYLQPIEKIGIAAKIVKKARAIFTVIATNGSEWSVI